MQKYYVKTYSTGAIFFIFFLLLIGGYFFFLKHKEIFYSHGKTNEKIFLEERSTSYSFLNSKDNNTIIKKKQDAQQVHIVSGVVKKGQNSFEIIGTHVSPENFYKIVKASEQAHSLKKLRVGQPYTLFKSSSNGSLIRFEYEINQTKKLVIESNNSEFKAYLQPIAYDCQLSCISGVIHSNLFDSIIATGESPLLALSMVDILSFEINFIRDLRVGDSFTILVEKLFKDNVFKGYGKILGVTFYNNGSCYEGYRFIDDNGVEQYYNAEGKSLKRVFLKVPLDFKRISSKYSLNRVHPIYCDVRPHLGIDYAAPFGTPVKSIGNGVIMKAGWGNGFGKMVIVKHKNNIESMYSHLSGFSSNLKVGTKVKQGQVIGYVGSTGLSTGPHLDFRIREKGQYINPEKIFNPRMGPVSPHQLEKYKDFIVEIKSYMDGNRNPEEYTPDSFL
ncbi:M23 family metallopeptidase [Lawsonia intracellularis]|uniref:Membrane proteins related to metalloendopeptidases n=1 Tax=Lawsonia intracellularis (strain PHE/MN1-00) TaxID=363253 RepID=Q1MQ85_LAWIP|nr:M23 family metallopeptidase [Lawsonia intracellularis]AGC50210.1 peptidase family M23 [Lawsonia intracellularis N343]KAA0204637.1 M23 family peptidase [Lawsonia intracellularis]MBZ3892651.1 M23 family metallopeptidase [Lawsonia intracellularis]OMQ03112.1 peptidase M24 [Lawsonia intracellularis]RBN33182.1 M23 family peptidase [Lawsonia intracellularis]